MRGIACRATVVVNRDNRVTLKQKKKKHHKLHARKWAMTGAPYKAYEQMTLC